MFHMFHTKAAMAWMEAEENLGKYEMKEVDETDTEYVHQTLDMMKYKDDVSRKHGCIENYRT